MTTNRPYSERIRAQLRKHPDGLTAQALAASYKLQHQQITSVLKRMPDTYISDWVKVGDGTGRKAALWKCVVPPPDAQRTRHK